MNVPCEHRVSGMCAACAEDMSKQLENATKVIARLSKDSQVSQRSYDDWFLTPKNIIGFNGASMDIIKDAVQSVYGRKI